MLSVHPNIGQRLQELKQTTSKANKLKVSGVYKTLSALPIIQSEPCAIFSLF